MIAIVGPTASGKSSLALGVAERIGAEILSADSRQLYRGMDIGTAKPSAADRARVPHHLIDVVDPGEPYTVFRFQNDARAALAAIHGRGRVALVVGGTGLYVRALLDGLALASSPHDPDLRARLEREEPAALHERLRVLDPESGSRVDPRNVQELSYRHCWCRWDGTSTLVHSRHPDVMAAIHRGDAFLSRLEGEWWMRFQDQQGTKRSGHHASVGHTTAARPISETKLI